MNSCHNRDKRPNPQKGNIKKIKLFLILMCVQVKGTYF